MNARIAVAGSMIAAALLGAGCSARSARLSGEGVPCSSSSQCARHQVCFLGECRAGSTALSNVLAEVRPPPGGTYGVQQVGSIDLRSTVIVNFTLNPALSVGGRVAQLINATADAGTQPLAQSSVTFSARSQVIPDRALQVSVQAANDGTFLTKLAEGTWDATLLPPAPLPPLYDDLGLSASTPALLLQEPATQSLQLIRGTIHAGIEPLANARVLAVDASGLVLAAAAQADGNGAFDLLLPPTVDGFFLRVGPPTDITPPALDAGNAAPIIPSYSAVGPFPADSGTLGWDFAEAPAPALVQGTVVDTDGNGVARARVYALSLDGHGYVLSTSVTTNADGSFQLPLLEGKFALEAAPAGGSGAPALSPELDVQLDAGTVALSLTCPARVQAIGTILQANGTPVPAGTQISATRISDRLVSSRVAETTPTDAFGNFHVTADPGSYRFAIAPPASSGLPEKLTSFDLEATTAGLPTITLSAPLEVVGTVTGLVAGISTPLLGATVEFFALDTSGAHSISLGSGLTDASGHYRAILPDVEQPAVAVAPRR